MTTEKDGFVNYAVSVIAGENTVDMRVSKAEAAQVRDVLRS